MISKKTKSFNLLNYLNQKKMEYKLTFIQLNDKSDENYSNWQGTFIFNDETYQVIESTKRKATKLLLEKAEQNIHSIVLKS